MSIDQVKERSFRETLLNKEYHEKQHLFRILNELRKWFRESFLPRENLAKELKSKIESQVNFNMEPFDRNKHMDLTQLD